MRIGRTIPPAASPIYIRDIINGFKGLFRGQKEIERFRTELKEHFGVKHIFLVSSGKSALTLILRALHELYPARDEVLIPAFCCFSVPSAIVRADLKIKLCDVDPNTLDFNYENIEKILSGKAENDPNQPINQSTNQPKASTEVANIQHTTNNQLSSAAKLTNSTNKINSINSINRLLAVIPVHLFGLVSDVKRVRKIVKDPEVAIIEDAAQVMGSKKNGKMLGTIGDVSFFSLGRSKSISTVEGGILLTNNDEIAQRISPQIDSTAHYSIFEQFKLILQAFALVIFQRPSFFWFPKLLPLLRVGDTIYDPEFKIRKLSAFQAGLTKSWKEKLHTFQEHRQAASQQWKSVLKTTSVHSYCTKNGHVPNLLRFPVRIDKRSVWDNILKQSDTNGLGIMFTYPDSINGIDELRAVFRGQTFPVAEKLPRQLLTIPVHPYVSPEDKKKILNLIAQSN